MDLIKTLLAVGAGSFLGGAGRYLVSLAMKSVSKGFPWATLAVNLLGCFLIGLLWGVLSKNGTEGIIPYSGPLWRFYDLLHLLKGGTDNAAGRQCLGIRRVCSHQCDCGYCPRCIGVFPGALNSLFIEMNRPRHPSGLPGLCSCGIVTDYRTLFDDIQRLIEFSLWLEEVGL